MSKVSDRKSEDLSLRFENKFGATYSGNELEIARAAWNAAVTEAADRCEAMCHKYMRELQHTDAADAADACKDAVRKIYSESA